MQQHEATCKYAPESTSVSATLLTRFETMESTISMLVRSNKAQEKTNKHQAELIRELKGRIVLLETTVSRLTPDYSHIELTHFSFPQYIMNKLESRQWVTKIMDRCKYKSPKYLFTSFMQTLMEDEPLFFRFKSYDIVTVSACFGSRMLKEADMPLREFCEKFFSVCLVLMKSIWKDVDEVNKVPFLPNIMCRGYSEEIQKRLERQGKFTQAQYARTHQLQLHQQWVASLESFGDWLRDSFDERVATLN